MSKNSGVTLLVSWRLAPAFVCAVLLAVGTLAWPAVTKGHDIPDGQGCNPFDGDGDDHAHVSVTGGTANETDGTVTFHVICNPCANMDASTTWATVNGTAIAGEDYVATSVPLQLGSDEGGAPDDFAVVVTLINDTDFEPDESFSLQNTAFSVGPPCLNFDASSASFTIDSEDPPNTPPTVSANNDPVVVSEGATANNSGVFHDDQGNNTVTLSASIGSVVKNDGAGTWTWSFGTTDGPDQSQVVTITATDDKNAQASDTFTLTVNNVPPSVAAPATLPEPSDEGAAVTAGANFSDPANANDAPYTCTVDYGDGSGVQAGSVVGSHCDGPSHVYADDGTFNVEVCVTDQDGAPGCNDSDHVVENVPPTVDSPTTSPEPSDEGSAVTAGADFSDPAGALDAPYTCTVDYGDSSGAQAGTVAGEHCSGPSHTYADNGTYNVEVCVTDKDGGEGCNDADHVVDNVDPSIGDTTNSAEACGETANGTPVDVSAEFSDPGFDSAAAGTLEDFDDSTIDWGDGTVEAADVAETAGGVGIPTTGTVSGTHTYASGGIYTIVITVADDDGGTDSATLTALVSGVGLTPEGLLGVVGTEFKDVVNIQRKGSAIEVQGPFLGPGSASFPVADVASLHVMACGGDDQIHVNHDVLVPAILDGGDGDDHIGAGGGPTEILGGEGADHLFGGRADDQVHGGAGDDELAGGPGNNLLDGGSDDDHCNAAQGVNNLLDCEN